MTIKHQPAPKADQARTIDAFAPVEVEVKPPLDRSTLEAWTVCPYQAHAIESGEVKVVGELAVAGELAHQAFSAATLTMIDAPETSPSKLAKVIEDTAVASRPDMQPEVITATRWMMWEWARYVACFNPATIRGFDGGGVRGMCRNHECDARGRIETTDPKVTKPACPSCGSLMRTWSGQHSAYIGDEEITTEFDFLATIDKEGYDVDFKTGWKLHDDDLIRDSFQFQFHAYIAFINFPDLETLNVQVWNTRKNRKSAWVPFSKKDIDVYRSRISTAIAIRARGEIEPWPTLEKCQLCPVALRCPAADPLVQVAANPQAMLKALVATEARRDALVKALTAHVDASGEVVVDNVAFGRSKPKSDRKQPVALYSRGEA